MSKTDFKEIKTLDNFFKLFRTLDKDDDGSLSIEESKPDLDRYDFDHNSKIELWELAKAVQKNQTVLGSSVLALFDDKKVERLKEAQAWVRKEERDIYHGISGVEAYFFMEKTDFSKSQKEILAKAIANAIPDYINPEYGSHIEFLEAIPNVAQHLKKAGYTNEEVFALLEKLCRNANRFLSAGYFMEYLFADLFAALKEQASAKQR